MPYPDTKGYHPTPLKPEKNPKTGKPYTRKERLAEMEKAKEIIRKVQSWRSSERILTFNDKNKHGRKIKFYAVGARLKLHYEFQKAGLRGWNCFDFSFGPAKYFEGK